MVCEIASLLTEKPEHYPLLREFHRFVRVPHKKMFNKLCEDLTGSSASKKKPLEMPQCSNGRSSTPTPQDPIASEDIHKLGPEAASFNGDSTGKSESKRNF
ncbi:hypothetical protein AB205_0207570 [Aquarana catesbeiana]|uniref:Uncharacterized protein n=1 Tax=Aquarana catesbeiana TaxID=8400 RepID=A0A2G9RUF5_AQUCT|nr:hypothetical protein AB205_0207570 [Aquarana catesbeiana]